MKAKTSQLKIAFRGGMTSFEDLPLRLVHFFSEFLWDFFQFCQIERSTPSSVFLFR